MQMNRDERFVFNKLLTGGFRIGVSQKMMVNALAKTVKANPSVIAHRISGKWDPSTTAFEELLNEHASAADASKPYRSTLLMRLMKNLHRSAIQKTGRLNGNGMAFAGKSSNAITNSLYGAAVKN